MAAPLIPEDMEAARRIQNAAVSLLPPKVPGLDIAIRLKHIKEIGGDFCLFVPPISSEIDTIGLILGDVSGKGVAAALLATSIAHLLPWLRPLANPPAAIAALNRDLWERTPRISLRPWYWRR